MTLSEERLIKESILLIGDMDQRLRDSYYCGEFTLEEFNEYQKMINLLYIVYNRIADVKNCFLIKTYLRVKGIKLKGKSIYIEFFNHIDAIHGKVKEKKFRDLKGKILRLSEISVPVKCICCGKKDNYNGNGTVLKRPEEFLALENSVGLWICSEECYNRLYTAS